MNWIRNIVLGLMVVGAASALADDGVLTATTAATATAKKTVAEGDLLSFATPKIGIRVEGGNWNQFMVGLGADVTFNVPLIPLPAIRVDGEIWGEPGSFGQNLRGNALSVLGIQTFIVGYAGLGPSYYFTDNDGDRVSGFGIKALGGINLPHSLYAEVSIIIGPSTPPIFVSLGERF